MTDPIGQPPTARPRSDRWWFWAAVALTAVKLWFTAGQTVFAIGPAIHDDKLFILLTEHLLNGQWLGPYNQFTLAKGPLYSLFVAGNFWVGLPLLLTQQLVYAGACAAVALACRPWLPRAGGRFTLYALLLANPMSYDASNMTRLMRQSLYTPLGMLVIAGLITVFARRRDSGRRLAVPAGLAGLAFGGFWLTREESVWLVPAIGLIAFGLVVAVRRDWRERGRLLVLAAAAFLVAFSVPVYVVSGLNLRHYGWFGTVEFRATDFKDAYGALTRIAVGPELPQVPVTRQMREAAYRISPTFAKLEPWLEGEVGDHWIERTLFKPEERQIRGGWFMWALRDAMAAAGLTPDARTAMANYRRIADEVNAACDAGRVPSRPARSGFFPRLTRDDVGPILNETRDYLVYFGAFKGFTAASPDSVGDYAELKPFRDYVGTHLSYAPRSPNPFPPEQSRLQHAQVDALETTGTFTATAFAWSGLVLLLVGAARAIESVWRRRLTFLLGLAGALLASVAAYLAINILITVTSFTNVSPGAMSGAYPLYLLALAAIATDAILAWGRAVAPAPAATAAPQPSRWRWLLPAGTALVVFAARLHEIHRFGGDLPYNDQWIVEAKQLIAPWLDGTLRPWTFFLPHFEHVPVWTRLLAWLEVVISGRWDPLLQMAVNSACYATFTLLVARWVWRTFSPVAAGFATGVLVLGGALPYAWENIAWGFQSQFPLALLCLWLHVHGSLGEPVNTRRWWLAQVAGLAGLFTLASMWLAPLAVAVILGWTGRREPRAWRVPAAIAALGILILGLVRWQAEAGYAFAQTSRTFTDFAQALIHLLGWPNGVPGAAAILLLPWLILALRLRGRADSSTVDRVILALGLWAILQAGGLAYARSGDNGDFVSRYGDVLFIGTLAGALALIRIAPGAGRSRTAWIVLALAWSGLTLTGLYDRSHEGHARYFHEHALANAQLRRDAVQSYLANGDRTLLERGATRWVLSESTGVVADLLDRPDFRALLPASVVPANSDPAIARGVRGLLGAWPWMLVLGTIAFGAGLVVLRYRGAARSPAAPAELHDRWALRLAVGVALASLVALAVWSRPLFMDRDTRWQQLLGGDAALTGMTFAFSAPTAFPDERLQGAAPIGPVELRNRLYGTAPAGPALTCTVYSSPFTVTKDWLIVPYAGYPVGVGNGLRVQLLAGDGHVEREIECHGPNVDDLAYWAVDLRALRGRRVRLVLYDGRVDTEAWVAAAPPIPSDSPELATTLAARLRLERQSGLQVSLVVIALVALIGAIYARKIRPVR